MYVSFILLFKTARTDYSEAITNGLMFFGYQDKIIRPLLVCSTLIDELSFVHVENTKQGPIIIETGSLQFTGWL